MNAAERPQLPDDLRARFDLADPAFIADPYPLLADIREHTPIFWHEPSGQWIITRHRDVHATLRDRRLGRAFTHRYTPAEFGQPEPDPGDAEFRASEQWSLLNLEPPDHTRIRRLITKVFTPTSVAALSPDILARANGQIDLVRDGDHFDLLADFAQPYSVSVICSMLGVPDTDTGLLLDWSHAIVKMYELDTTEAQRVAANQAAAEFVAYVTELIAHRRRRPTAGLLSALVTAEDEGTKLTDDEIVSTAIVLLNAGHEATVNTLGNGFRALMRHPEQWTRLTSGEVPAKAAVEELIRWDSPLQLFERWVLDDGVAIAGQPLAVGDEVAMLFGSANRDRDQFPDADAFDIGRNDPSHVGFGGGIHFCIGAPLARLELTHAVARLVEHLPGLTLASEPRYHQAFVIRGLAALELSTR